MLLQELLSEQVDNELTAEKKKQIDTAYDIDKINGIAHDRFKEHETMSLAELKKKQNEFKMGAKSSNHTDSERYYYTKEAELLQHSIAAKD